MNVSNESHMPHSTTILPLPTLPVTRHTHCSQNVADQAIEFIALNCPDLIQQIAAQILLERNSIYQRLINKAAYYLTHEASKTISVPTTHLGMLDLVFELTRRIGDASNIAVALEGNALAESPTAPLPPLAEGRIFSEAQGITQAIADQVSRTVYDRRPDIVYELSEQIRRGIRLDSIERAFFSFVHAELDDELHLPSGLPAKTDLLGDLCYRLRRMMGLKGITGLTDEAALVASGNLIVT